MSPALLRRRIHECLQELLEPGAWDHASQIEQAEVQQVQEFAQAWQAMQAQGATA